MTLSTGVARGGEAGRPSPGHGVRRAIRLWPLMLAVWITSELILLPAQLVGRLLRSPTTGTLPAPELLAPGDLTLIQHQLTDRASSLLPALAVVALLMTWAWTVTWRAGLVRHRLWATGRPATVAELVGYGVGGWSRWAGLSLTGLVMLALPLLAIWLPIIHQRWHESPLSSPLRLYLLIAAAIVTALLALLCRAATMAGYWLLATPSPITPPRAWLDGLAYSLRHPVRSLGAVVLATATGALLGAMPLAAGWWLPGLRGGPGLLIVSLIAGLAQAFVAVTILLAFEPIAGWLSPPEPPPGPEPRSSGPSAFTTARHTPSRGDRRAASSSR